MRSSIVSYCCTEDGKSIPKRIPNKLILRKLNLRTDYRADSH